jgi:Sec-independent protein translocase protein TatA
MPEIGKSIGRALGEFRRASNDFKRSLEEEVSADDLRSLRRDLQEPPEQRSPVKETEREEQA